MTLKRLRRHWDVLGKKDPLWAVLASDDKRGNREEVTGLLPAEGATILDVRVDRFAGASWAGSRYTVTK